MNNFFLYIARSDFIRSVTVLGSGTIFAQVITIGASPILTRLYSPTDFALLALFAAFIASITPIICGKYEVAIVVAKTLNQSKDLLGIAFWVAPIISVVLLFGVFIFGDLILLFLKAEALVDWIYLLPLALIFTGIMTALNHYSNRLHEYQVIARSKMLMAIFSVIFGIGFGLIGYSEGLLISSVLSTIFASAWLLFYYKKTLGKALLAWSPRKTHLVRKFRSFPIYNATTGLLDGVTLALPVFFLSRYFPEAVVGYYALMLRIAVGPISFISGAVSQVNLKKVAYLANHNQQIRPYLLKVTFILIAVITPMSVILMQFAPSLVSWIFGDEWELAGIYLQILMPALALRFVVSTLSTTLSATGHNRLGAIWKVTAFVVTFAVLMIFAPEVDALGIFFVLLLTDITLYSFYYFLVWYAAGNPMERH